MGCRSSKTSAEDDDEDGDATYVQQLRSYRRGGVNLVAMSGYSYVHVAAKRGYVNSLLYLHKHGANLHPFDGYYCAPAHYAAVHDRTVFLQCLDALGVDLNDVDGRAGGTPLHWAAAGRSGGSIRLLCAAGSDPNARDFFGATPAHWAVSRSHALAFVGEGKTYSDINAARLAPPSDPLATLHRFGADLTQGDVHGATPAHLAALHRQKECLRLLHKADAF